MNSSIVNGRDLLKSNSSVTNQVDYRDLLAGDRQVGVGVFDGLSALLAARYAFDFLWLGSFSVSAAAGVPDASIIGPEELLRCLRVLRRATKMPVVVDLDAGFGDPAFVYYVVQEFARAGATSISIEDNPTSKRCSFYEGVARTVVPIEVHTARIRAAAEAIAKVGFKCILIGRTEALVAGLGVHAAIQRAEAYKKAGADAIFVQSLDALGDEVLEFGRAWGRRSPLFIAPTRFPRVPLSEIFCAGISHIIYANQALRAAHRAMLTTFAELAGAGAPALEDYISSIEDVANEVGYPRIVELESEFEGGESRSIRRVNDTRSR